MIIIPYSLYAEILTQKAYVIDQGKFTNNYLTETSTVHDK